MSSNPSQRQATLTDFFTRERQNLITYFRSKLRDLSEMDLEDVVSDVFVNLLSRVNVASPVENLAAYVYRSVSNRLMDTYRQRQRTVSLDAPVDNDSKLTPAALLTSSMANPEEEQLADDLRDRLYQALETLEPRQRAIWIATEIEGNTFRELAELWDEPIGTLLARKHRATQALQKQLLDWKE